MKRFVSRGLLFVSALVGVAVVWSYVVRRKSLPDSAFVALHESAAVDHSPTAQESGCHVRGTQPARDRPQAVDGDGEDVREEEFDALTDELIASKTELTIDDVERFSCAFKRLPSTMRDGCLHRALNLLPDEKIILCTGILMDKKMDPLAVRIVFEDILNRNPSVKEPILKEIVKDKTHPCCSDAEWIFEVTGEKPE